MIPIMPERSCGDCKSCCEGWLWADIYGDKMYTGKPCHYICDSGCSIYENRPENPCVNYKCLWLINNSIPGWMKPNKCGVILTERQKNDIYYIEAIETGIKMDSSVLSWLFHLSIKNNINICYHINREPFFIGSKNFLEIMTQK